MPACPKNLADRIGKAKIIKVDSRPKILSGTRTRAEILSLNTRGLKVEEIADWVELLENTRKKQFLDRLFEEEKDCGSLREVKEKELGLKKI